MFSFFKDYLKQCTEISEEEIRVIYSKGKERNLRKSQSLLHDGEVWNYNCFIISGCFRLYRFGEDGTDHTMRFGIESWWMTDQESYNNRTPSEYNTEALSKSTVILWTKEDWQYLLSAIPALKLFETGLQARAYEASQRRIYSLISGSAEEKYIEFQKTYPHIFNKIPLYMVASYLGMSRETLSRIRKEGSVKNKT
ncbi:Crp/Fnr family transcriptional regulator [uncultured Chryseobacterium sp.]|uniref:Crp/Fnr family transcriptional regulator n=1 Tax=uncultured Chryseobacterium sp. TaxID=259322 RepID=UPI0025D25096|nr:Crp/Fnr family transcriptional regulator [uncultured Chryseobacterium sp.]